MELVLLHGFDSRPENLLGVADAIREALPELAVRLLTGPVPLASGGWAWWNDGDPIFGTLAAALAWIVPQLAESPVVVAGFSQGGSVALGLAFADLATVVGVGSVGGFVSDELPVGPTSTPIFIAHGHADDVVDVFHAESLARRATRLGIAHTLVLHEGGHAWTSEVTEAFVLWLIELAGHGAQGEPQRPEDSATPR